MEASSACVPPVTVLVPCFNEEEGLPWLLERLGRMHEAHPDWRFLFVDDGSTDDTFTLLLRAASEESWIELVRHPVNMGLGAAMRTAFEQIESPIVCSMDSDCTYPPERLPEMVERVRDGAGIVTASVWHPDVETSEGSSFRLALSRGLSRIYRGLLGQDVYTFTCLFRAYDAEVLRRTRFFSDGFAAVAELFVRALLSGFRVEEVPMALEARRFGESKMNVRDSVLAHVRLLTIIGLSVGWRTVRSGFRAS